VAPTSSPRRAPATPCAYMPAYAADCGCIGAADLPLALAQVDPEAVECVWDDARPFRGWQREARGTPPAPYGRLLRKLVGM
jgi:hypothetical protein